MKLLRKNISQILIILAIAITTIRKFLVSLALLLLCSARCKELVTICKLAGLKFCRLHKSTNRKRRHSSKALPLPVASYSANIDLYQATV